LISPFDFLGTKWTKSTKLKVPTTNSQLISRTKHTK
jgi:hypothetical protein